MILKEEAKQKFISQIHSFLPFKVNSDQEKAIDLISNFIFQSQERGIFILKGYAGTGKTKLISAITKALPGIKWRSVLLAPTGRAAKVLSAYSQRPAFTIHKKIFRKQSDESGTFQFYLAENLHRHTLFIVDEASMISANEGGENLFQNILENLFEYVYSGENCKLILVGDNAQLPPIGSNESPALDSDYLKSAFYLNISHAELKEVARQKNESGILYNATNLRLRLTRDNEGFVFPKLNTFNDFIRLNGEDLEDELNTSLSKYGEDNVIIITRSNKQAKLFNQAFRNRVKLYEEDLCVGDKLMVVKNNYFWLPESNLEAGFIANGDTIELTKIINREELYGFRFCECCVSFKDYPNLPEFQLKLITDCLYTDHPSLTSEQQKELYEAVMEDVKNEPNRSVRSAYVRKSNYYNSLQVKFSYAITCHKSQGGQWPVVFIDQGFLKEEQLDKNLLRWLYTAITRATDKVYLINFSDYFFD